MNKITNHQLYRLIIANFLEIIREPAVLFWGIVFPILMAWGLGIAFTHKTDVTRKIAIVESAESTQNSKLFLFLNSNAEKTDGHYRLDLKNEKLGNLILTFTIEKWENAYTLLKKGNVSLILEDQGKDMKYHFDPTSSEALELYQQINQVLHHGVQSYSANQEEIQPLTISGTRYIDFLIPGLLAMGVMMSSTWGICYTLIDRRSKKLVRRMVATPMKKSNFLLALMFARFTMNLAEAFLLFAFAWFYFHIRIQGSILALVLLFIAGNIAFSGIAVLVSSRTANPEVGNGIINAIVTPMMVVSGIFFSYHNFPEWSIPVIRNLPLTILADGVRSTFNEGVSAGALYKEIIILSVTGIICFIGGLKIFKWY